MIDSWDTLETYLRRVSERGDTPKPIYAVLERGINSAHPAGSLVAWSLNKKDARKAYYWPHLTRLVKITVET